MLAVVGILVVVPLGIYIFCKVCVAVFHIGLAVCILLHRDQLAVFVVCIALRHVFDELNIVKIGRVCLLVVP